MQKQNTTILTSVESEDRRKMRLLLLATSRPLQLSALLRPPP
ncbi:hypothetical protein ACP4OV_000298 [Aristida adscensionis]